QADGARVAVLRDCAARIGDREADRARVLFDSRHQDTGNHHGYFAGHQFGAEHTVSGHLDVQAGAERWAGAGDRAGVLFRFLRVVSDLSAALWPTGNTRNFEFHWQDFAVLGDHGSSLLGCGTLHGVHDTFAVHCAVAGVHRAPGWGDRLVSVARLD